MTIHSGKRHKTLKGDEVDEYVTERGRRGKKLPQGFRKVDHVIVEYADNGEAEG